MSFADLDWTADVSRETLERLKRYVAMVNKWNPAINLVARSTLDQIWDRHIRDSAQVFSYRPATARRWADIGSGGGFPGIVVSILAAEAAPDLQVDLVESDIRKATFLRQVVRELALSARVHAARIESLVPLGADVVSARALASLDVLCGFAARHLAEGGLAIFPKGAKAEEEIAAARKNWLFDLTEVNSITHPEAKLIMLKAIHHV